MRTKFGFVSRRLPVPPVYHQCGECGSPAIESETKGGVASGRMAVAPWRCSSRARWAALYRQLAARPPGSAAPYQRLTSKRCVTCSQIGPVRTSWQAVWLGACGPHSRGTRHGEGDEVEQNCSFRGHHTAAILDQISLMDKTKSLF